MKMQDMSFMDYMMAEYEWRRRKEMDKKLKDRIMASYELHDNDDISTERLLQMVADDCHCDVSKVVQALSEGEEKENGCE